MGATAPAGVVAVTHSSGRVVVSDRGDELKARLLAIMESIDRNAGTAHPTTQDGLSDEQVLVLGLLSVSRSNFRGVYFLLKEDHSEQARIVGRTLLMDSMRLWYMRANADRLEILRIAFELGSIRQEKNLVHELVKHEGESEESKKALAIAEEQEKALRGLATQQGCDEETLNREILILDKAEALFNATPQPEGYFIFRHASHAAHTSRVAIEAAKIYQEDGTVQLSFGGSPGNVLRVGIQAAQVFLVAYRSAAELVHWDTVDMIKSFSDHVTQQLEDLVADASIGGLDRFLSEEKVVTPIDSEAPEPK